MVVGLDVGGTKVLGVAVDASDPAVARAEHRIPTPEGPDALLAGLEEVVAALAAEVGRPPLAVGVGLPGLVDLGGTLRTAPHLPGVQDLAVAARLSARLGIRVEADNDANCHARAEHRIGAAKGVDEALVVTFGTGIGGGVVTGGRVLRGAVGAAGEPGHMVVDPAGPRCACGRRGCWEMYGSGTGLARLAVEAAFAGRIDAAVRLAGGRPESVRGEHVAEAARAGDAG
ncbi:MAG: ROK family protein, partial [Acidimicrobiia bacterium]